MIYQFFLSKLNAHNMLDTYIYHHRPPNRFGVGYTVFRVTKEMRKAYRFWASKAMVSLKMVEPLLRHAGRIGDTFVYLTYYVHLYGM